MNETVIATYCMQSSKFCIYNIEFSPFSLSFSLPILPRSFLPFLSLSPNIQSQLLINPDSIKHYDKVNDLLPELRHLLHIDPDQKDQDRIKNILNELSNLLIVSLYTDEPNRSNQIMLDNFGRKREREGRERGERGKVERNLKILWLIYF